MNTISVGSAKPLWLMALVTVALSQNGRSHTNTIGDVLVCHCLKSIIYYQCTKCKKKWLTYDIQNLLSANDKAMFLMYLVTEAFYCLSQQFQHVDKKALKLIYA